MQLLDGKLVSGIIKETLQVEVEALQRQGLRPPHLAAILVGEHPASKAYVASKIKTCEYLQFKSTLIRLNEDVSESYLLEQIQALNESDEVDGILVQLPLPAHIREHRVIEAIRPEKDVDGFHPVNQGRLLAGLPSLLPATPYGILLLLEHYQIPTAGMHCVVLGRSNIVGTPMSVLMSRNTYPGNCTVTLCHSKTNDLASYCREADLLIAAIGKAGFVKADMVKPGAVVVDVGINRGPSASSPQGYRLTGDVDFDAVAPKCSWITPVPGGVGLMTICGLMKNTLKAYQQNRL